MEREIDTFRASTARWLVGSFAGWLTILSCAIGLGFLIILVKWIENISTKYELTSQRLIIKSGLIFKKIDEIELYRIKDIKVEFSLLNQFVDIGTIVLRTTDNTTNGVPLFIKLVPNARNLRETMRTVVEEARQTRRVREIDFDVESR